MPNTLRPSIHNSFRTFSTDSAHSSLASPFLDSAKAFRNFKTFSTDSAHSTMYLSGYEYYQDLISIILKEFDILVNCTDDQLTMHTKYIEELVNPWDGVNDGTRDIEELVPVLDEWLITHYKYIEETVNVTDIVFDQSTFESLVPVLDEWLITHYKYIEETVNVTDSVDAFEFTDFVDSVVIKCVAIHDKVDTVLISTSDFTTIDVTDTIVIGVIPTEFIGITLITDG